MLEEVYISQPQGFENQNHPSHVCRLTKALYGLKQALHAWFHTLKAALNQWGFMNSKTNTSLFYFRNNNTIIIVLVYVDDILITGNDNSTIIAIIDKLSSQFALKTLGSLNYFLGFEVCRNSIGLYLSQHKYIKDLLTKANMSSCKPCSNPFSTSSKLSLYDGEPIEDPSIYRSLVGDLQYPCNTRSDISFVVNKLSQFLSNPLQPHWIALKRFLRYLQGSSQLALLSKPSSTPLALHALL